MCLLRLTCLSEALSRLLLLKHESSLWGLRRVPFVMASERDATGLLAVVGGGLFVFGVKKKPKRPRTRMVLGTLRLKPLLWF